MLNKQVKACINDYNRLKRNIELLRNDIKAIAAFRLMNTAMFMQLHHGIHSKKDKPFTDPDSEEYYKDVEIKKIDHD